MKQGENAVYSGSVTKSEPIYTYNIRISCEANTHRLEITYEIPYNQDEDEFFQKDAQDIELLARKIFIYESQDS